jgi:hypothetical protein
VKEAAVACCGAAVVAFRCEKTGPEGSRLPHSARLRADGSAEVQIVRVRDYSCRFSRSADGSMILPCSGGGRLPAMLK